jgi:hypothetical protein
MMLIQDWYIYHSKDETNWFLQAGGPYTEEESKRILEEEEAGRKMEHRVARVSYPQGAKPDEKIERSALDLANQNRG